MASAMTAATSTSAYVHDRYLDAEERYEIFVVKAAERPHLLHWTAAAAKTATPSSSLVGGTAADTAEEEDGHDDEKKIENDHHDSAFIQLPPPLHPLPLTDGCDIPGWRSQRIAPGMTNSTHHHHHHFIPMTLLIDPQNNSDNYDKYNKNAKIIATLNKDNDDSFDSIEFPLGGSLNIGAGSTLTRLESQFPFMTSSLYCTKRNNPDINHQWRQGSCCCCCCWWHHAKQQYRARFTLMKGGLSVAPTIEYEEAKRLVNYCSIHGNEGMSAVASSSSSSSSSSNITGSNSKKLHDQQYHHHHGQISFFVKEYEIKNRPVKILGATKGWLAMPSYAPSTPTNFNNRRENDDIDIVCCDRLSRQDVDINNNINNLPDNSASSSSSSMPWRDIGQESMLFQGGGRGGWTFANLLSRYGNISFRFSDTHGEMMSLSTYAKYIINPEGMLDDSPLGIYDSEFGDDLSSPISELLKEYSVLECFSRDLFDLANDDDDDDDDDDIRNNVIEKGDGNEDTNSTQTTSTTTRTRPPYRWILIGPERSGTGMHVDPLWTNAWVTVLQGQKQWLLFPPDTPYASIGMIEGTPQIPSSIWFRDYYDVVTSPSWPKQYQPVEVLQNPGETVFVPAGWPHLVLNLELTVAVTHNYASEYGPHFDTMWEEVVRDEPDFAARWLAGLWKAGRDDLTRVTKLKVKGTS